MDNRLSRHDVERLILAGVRAFVIKETDPFKLRDLYNEYAEHVVAGAAKVQVVEGHDVRSNPQSYMFVVKDSHG